LSGNLDPSTSWKTQGLFEFCRPVIIIITLTIITLVGVDDYKDYVVVDVVVIASAAAAVVVVVVVVVVMVVDISMPCIWWPHTCKPVPVAARTSFPDLYLPFRDL